MICSKQTEVCTFTPKSAYEHYVICKNMLNVTELQTSLWLLHHGYQGKDQRYDTSEAKSISLIL